MCCPTYSWYIWYSQYPSYSCCSRYSWNSCYSWYPYLLLLPLLILVPPALPAVQCPWCSLLAIQSVQQLCCLEMFCLPSLEQNPDLPQRRGLMMYYSSEKLLTQLSFLFTIAFCRPQSIWRGGTTEKAKQIRGALLKQLPLALRSQQNSIQNKFKLCKGRLQIQLGGFRP